MKIDKKLIISSIVSTIFSIALVNIGILVIGKEKYIGLITILIGVALLFFAYYSN